jgi:4-hydroxy-tetrahydrodipicolinate reductase
MLRLAVSGSTGRMGKELLEKINESLDMSLAFEFSSSEPLSLWDPNLIDAVVDFSLPDSFLKIFDWCAENKKPLVSGTTGFDFDMFEKLNVDCPFLHSGNFSLGIAALVKSIQNFKKSGMGLEVWIEDVHHIHKLDAPSGTAVLLQKEILRSLNISHVEIKSTREGEIFGVHKIHIKTAHEKVVLEHEALDRGVFAEGALNAVQWLTRQKPGIYKFEDYLNS